MRHASDRIRHSIGQGVDDINKILIRKQDIGQRSVRRNENRQRIRGNWNRGDHSAAGYVDRNDGAAELREIRDVGARSIGRDRNSGGLRGRS